MTSVPGLSMYIVVHMYVLSLVLRYLPKSEMWNDKMSNFPPRGNISPLGAKFTPRGEFHPWGRVVKLKMALCVMLTDADICTYVKAKKYFQCLCTFSALALLNSTVWITNTLLSKYFLIVYLNHIQTTHFSFMDNSIAMYRNLTPWRVLNSHDLFALIDINKYR
jgi:hypothetical protein